MKGLPRTPSSLIQFTPCLSLPDIQLALTHLKSILKPLLTLVLIGRLPFVLLSLHTHLNTEEVCE